jgi:ribosomal protein L37AE/L43A
MSDPKCNCPTSYFSPHRKSKCLLRNVTGAAKSEPQQPQPPANPLPTPPPPIEKNDSSQISSPIEIATQSPQELPTHGAPQVPLPAPSSTTTTLPVTATAIMESIPIVVTSEPAEGPTIRVPMIYQSSSAGGDISVSLDIKLQLDPDEYCHSSKPKKENVRKKSDAADATTKTDSAASGAARTWACGMCDKEFNSKADWQAHQSTHGLATAKQDKKAGKAVPQSSSAQIEAESSKQSMKPVVSKRSEEVPSKGKGPDQHTTSTPQGTHVKSERTTKKSDSDTKEEETIIWSCKECGLDFGGHHAMRQHQTAVSHKGYIRKVVDDSKTGTQKPNPPNNRQKTTAAPATGANDEIWICGECEREFSSEAGFQQHQTATSHKDPTCAVCSKCFSSKAALTQHCSSTGHGFASQRKAASSAGAADNRGADINATWTCGECEREFSSLPGLQQHQTATAHSDPACVICFKSFSSKTALLQHCESTGHMVAGAFSCPACDRSFSQVSALEQHFRATHNTAPKTSGDGKTANKNDKQSESYM